MRQTTAPPSSLIPAFVASGSSWAVGILILLLMTALSGCLEKPESAQPLELSEAELAALADERIANVAALSLTFRDAAGQNVQEALRIFAHETLKTESGVLDPTWNGHLRVFFLNAYPIVGNMDSRQSIVAFFNPWLDIIVRSSWEEGQLKSLVMERGASYLQETSVDETATLPRYLINNPLLPLSDRMIIAASQVRETFVDREETRDTGDFSLPSQDQTELDAIMKQIEKQVEFFTIFRQTTDYMNLIAEVEEAIGSSDSTRMEQVARRGLSERERDHLQFVVQALQEDEFKLGHVVWSTDGTGEAVAFLTGRSHPGCAIILPVSSENSQGENRPFLRTIGFLDLVTEPSIPTPVTP